MITSNTNPKVKEVVALLKKAKARKEAGAFVIEGRKMYFEVLRQRPEVLRLSLWSESAFAALTKEELTAIGETPYELVADSVFEKMAETVTPQGVLAVVSMPQYDWEALAEGESMRLVLLERLQDPGNLGTIIRTAEAAGMTGIVLTEDSVDFFSPKVVRSTMGAIFRVPFLVVPSMADCVQQLTAQGVHVYAAHLEGSVPYDRVSYGSRYGLLIGNEANGLTEETTAVCTGAVRIPMCGQVESLNAAVACGILMYEAQRENR